MSQATDHKFGEPSSMSKANPQQPFTTPAPGQFVTPIPGQKSFAFPFGQGTLSDLPKLPSDKTSGNLPTPPSSHISLTPPSSNGVANSSSPTPAPPKDAGETFKRPSLSLKPKPKPEATPEPLPLQYGEPFDGDRIIKALQQNYTLEEITAYVNHYADDEIKRSLSKPRYLTKLLEQNHAGVLRLLIPYNLDLNAVTEAGVSVLAHAIMYSSLSGHNVVDIVKILLANGARPDGIPREWWINYIETPDFDSASVPEKPWTQRRRKILAETLNLSIRYCLWKASRAQKPTARRRQIATAHNIMPLLGLSNTIIGQDKAVAAVTKSLFSWFARNKENGARVMVFAGVSGHGKTELAKQLGPILSVPICEIDLTHVQEDFGLLGAPAGYQDSEVGSQMNNFLREHSGERSIVFLDEYDKTTNDVRRLLLKVMDEGKYYERGTTEVVDCSKTIWILASNAGASQIQRFYREHIAAAKNPDIVDIEPLVAELTDLYSSLYTNPVCARIDEFVPFLPFHPDEQAIIAHKFFLELYDELRKPVDTRETALRFLGHSTLSLTDDGKICKHLARNAYHEGTGARSLRHRIDALADDFVEVYCESEELISEKMNAGPREEYLVKLIRTQGGGEKLAIVRDTVRKEGGVGEVF